MLAHNLIDFRCVSPNARGIVGPVRELAIIQLNRIVVLLDKTFHLFRQSHGLSGTAVYDAVYLCLHRAGSNLLGERIHGDKVMSNK